MLEDRNNGQTFETPLQFRLKSADPNIPSFHDSMIKGFSKNPCYKRDFGPKTGLKRAKGLFGPGLKTRNQSQEQQFLFTTFCPFFTVVNLAICYRD